MDRAVNGAGDPAGPRGLLLEGIPGSGKSTVFRALSASQRVQALPEPGRFFFPEQLTQRVLERAYRAGTLDPGDHAAHLGGIVAFLEQQAALLRDRGFAPAGPDGFLYVIERFHLTHLIDYAYLRWGDLQPVDAALGALGCRMCLFVVDGDTLRRRLFRPRWPGWLSYLDVLADGPAAVVDHYLRAQDRFLALAQRSALVHEVIDTSGDGRDAVLRRVLDHWISPALEE